MLVGLFHYWFVIALLGASAFIGTVVYLVVSNRKMKRNFPEKNF